MSFVYVNKRVLQANADTAQSDNDCVSVSISSMVMFKWMEEDIMDTQCSRSFKKFKRRGPERSSYIEVHKPLEVRIGFHKLSIMDPNAKGDQPFVDTYVAGPDGRAVNRPQMAGDEVPAASVHTHTLYAVCNGDIYNFKRLLEINKFTNFVHSGSDCEVIPLLYKEFGIDGIISQISGEFALIIVDLDENGRSLTVHAARDPVGVKPLFWANDERGFALCSELKGLVDVVKHPIPFPPGSVMSARFTLNEDTTIAEPVITRTPFFSCDYPAAPPVELSLRPQIYARIREVLTDCVCERLQSSRPLCVLLSGGLDSSLVAAIAAQELRNRDPHSQLQTFTIGMTGSTDVKSARIVAEHIASRHHEVPMTPSDAIRVIPKVVHAIETYDITTVRSSTVLFLLSKYISSHTDIKVVLIADGSDEITAGYIYHHNAPSPEAVHEDAKRLLRELHLYDLLRAERCTAYHGLQSRLPFLDRKFIDYYMSLPPELRAPRKSEILGITDRNIEKPLLREAFAGSGLLPDAVLRRTKEALSDGVSSPDKSLYEFIQESLEDKISDEAFEREADAYTHLKPHSKEALYYRNLFKVHFQNEENIELIPKYWLPSWSPLGVPNCEPSARVLPNYRQLHDGSQQLI